MSTTHFLAENIAERLTVRVESAHSITHSWLQRDRIQGSLARVSAPSNESLDANPLYIDNLVTTPLYAEVSDAGRCLVVQFPSVTLTEDGATLWSIIFDVEKDAEGADDNYIAHVQNTHINERGRMSTDFDATLATRRILADFNPVEFSVFIADVVDAVQNTPVGLAEQATDASSGRRCLR